MIRRRICTAHNFANKPVFFACNGVQMRQRVSYKPDTKESVRTARNSRNASRVWKKILPKAAQRAGVPDDRRKQGGEWCTVQHPERRHAQRQRGEARHGEGIKGRGKARRGENVRRGVVVRVQLLARAYIYISAIYIIFIYILSIYL